MTHQKISIKYKRRQEWRNRRTKKTKDLHKTNKIADINPMSLVIKLDINGLNTLIKIQRLAGKKIVIQLHAIYMSHILDSQTQKS